MYMKDAIGLALEIMYLVDDPEKVGLTCDREALLREVDVSDEYFAEAIEALKQYPGQSSMTGDLGNQLLSFMHTTYEVDKIRYGDRKGVGEESEVGNA